MKMYFGRDMDMDRDRKKY
jgi:hypothetical protein